jgi:glyoxylase-like metal-dependent hydrolase (beta-lactamase superfamily II)
LDQNRLKIAAVVSQPFGENSYVVWFAGENECVVLDPGFEPDLVLAQLQRHKLSPAAILNTHGHSDHIAGNAAIKDRWPDCPLVIGVHEAEKLLDPMQNLSGLFGLSLVSPPADKTVADGDQYLAAGIEFQVREIPGHSSGHVVFVLPRERPVIVFGGDVLFAGGIGRTDFPGGDFGQLAHGIREKLYTLPDDTIVYPGHGEPTTIGEEKRTNPFVSDQGR